MSTPVLFLHAVAGDLVRDVAIDKPGAFPVNEPIVITLELQWWEVN